MYNYLFGKNFVRRFSFAFLCAAPLFACAQEGLVGRQIAPVSPSFAKTASSAKTASLTHKRTPKKLKLPFFDNFAYRSYYPDTNLWYDDTSYTSSVCIRRTSAILPPDIGTALLDGRKNDGTGYRPASNNSVGAVPVGFADSLTSHYIDLKNLKEGDSLYLSFFYQPGGRGPMPSVYDSLVLYFAAKDTSDNIEFVPVWSALSDSVPNKFHYARILLNDSSYFHDAFQFQFRNVGRLNGGYDFWHLDYVYLNKNRTKNDTAFFLDRTFSEELRFPDSLFASPLYRGLPSAQLSPQNALPYRINTVMHALSPDTLNVSARIRLDFIETAGLFPLTTTVAADIKNTVLQGAADTVLVGCNFIAPYLSPAARIGALRYQFYMDADAQDPRKNNDTLETFLRVDSLLIYDDGESEEGYGVRSARAFGQKFKLAAKDSLSAVWIQFFSNGQIFNFKAFRLAIWSASEDSLPSDILHSQYVNLDYGVDTNNFFIRFPIKDLITNRASPFALPDSFIVGIIQLDDKLLGVGYDMSIDNGANVYYDSSGVWRNSQLGGTLMIRAELTSGSSLVSRDSQKLSTDKITLYPNPLSQNEISLTGFKTDTYRRADWRLIDGLGRTVETGAAPITGTNLSLAIDSRWASGIYTLAVTFWDDKGTPRVYRAPLAIQR